MFIVRAGCPPHNPGYRLDTEDPAAASANPHESMFQGDAAPYLTAASAPARTDRISAQPVEPHFRAAGSIRFFQTHGLMPTAAAAADPREVDEAADHLTTEGVNHPTAHIVGSFEDRDPMRRAAERMAFADREASASSSCAGPSSATADMDPAT